MEIGHLTPAVVTGGASGLGEAVARRLSALGAKVAIFDRDKARGEQVAAEFDGVFCEVDVCSDDSVDAGFAKARAVHGQERILINCAGIANGFKTAGFSKKSGQIEPFPMREFERAVQINLIGTFRCVSRSAAGMLTVDPLEGGDRGAIVNTASVAAQDGQIGQAAYAASKAGVLGMTLPIARDLMGDAIRINTILPGIFATPMMRGLPENVQEALAATVPYPKRLGAPEEYADLAIHLIGNGYINGEHVRLDGAIRMAPR